MRKRYSIFSFLLFLVAAVIYFYYPTDENRIRSIMQKSEETIVTEDIEGLMKLISYNYLDAFGNGYLQIKKIMQMVFRRLNKIDIERNILKLTVRENKADAELSVRVIASEGGDIGYIIGDAGSPETIRIYFEKSSNTWLITKTEGIFNRMNMY